MERTTFPCHCTTLRYAAQTLTEVYDRVLAPSGLKVTQYVLLESILQNEAEPSMTDLAQQLGSERSTMGRNIHLLARDELVSLSRGSDRREHTVHVTERGHEAVSLARPLWQKAQTAVAKPLDRINYRSSRHCFLKWKRLASHFLLMRVYTRIRSDEVSQGTPQFIVPEKGSRHFSPPISPLTIRRNLLFEELLMRKGDD